VDGDLDEERLAHGVPPVKHLWGVVAVVLAAACGGERAPEFVGSESCAGCHAAEAERWRTSHHALAMQVANDSTLLGDWNGASLTDAGITTTFSTSNGRRAVTTAGEDGKAAEFIPAFTFGVHPLQQVLLPLSRGRLQAPSVAWDARPKEQGGQRWYHLNGGDSVGVGHPLHWTSRDLTWNYQCAECHSTELRKGYVAATDSYATTFKEVNVGCEACHGPGSDHVRRAGGRQATGGTPVGGFVTALGYDTMGWVFGAGDSIAHRASPSVERREVETCGRCHARRGVTEEGFAYGQPLLASHRPALLEPGLYWPDGQIRDEVYEYGSFLTSRMSRAGVTCSDCHDPHSAARPADNTTCAKCHLPATFDTPRHTRHAAGSPASTCVSCHMPSKTYMGVDVRHDHSFRIPRPDLTVALGTPNACGQCHAEKGAQWATARIVQWTGRRRDPADHFGATFARADRGDPSVAPALLALAEDGTRPVMVRASAWARLAAFPSVQVRTALTTAAADPDPLIRFGAVRALEGLRSIDRVEAGVLLIADTVRTIRTDAALVMLEARDQLPKAQREGLDRALAEWEATQRLNADRPEARSALAVYYGNIGRTAEAESELLAAIRLDAEYAPAYANLADLYRSLGRDTDGFRVLTQALERQPNDAALHHALGLTLVRQREILRGVVELTRAVELAPDDARFSYVLAVALHDTGQPGAARKVIDDALRHHPFEPSLLEARNAWRSEGP
jgi:Flp pilus assembly protein TadD